MKLKCPTCQTELRYIASSKFFLCNDCGYHIEGEPDPEPVTTETNRNGGTAIAKPSTTQKPKKGNPVFQSFNPWEFKSHRFVFLGIWIGVIALYATIANILKPTHYQPQTAIAQPEQGIRIESLPAICQPRSHIHLSYQMFEQCFPEGITYEQVTEIIGSSGRLFSQSGSLAIYQWENRKGSMSASFRDSKLLSKSQINLALDVMADYEPGK